MTKRRSTRTSQAEIERLRARLAEAEETLHAIRTGEVDAIAVDGPHGRQLFTLQSADQPYRVLAERMSEGAASMTADGTILFCNQRLSEMVGRPPETIVGLSATRLVPPASINDFQEFLASGLKGEARRELQFQRNDGSVIPVLASLTTIPGEQGPGLCLVAMDFSEHRLAEKTIRLQAAQYAALLATTSDGYWRFNRPGKFLDVSDAYCQMSGYSREEFLELRIADVVADEGPAEILRHIEKVARTGFDRFVSKHRRKNGQIFDVEVSASYFKATDEFILFVRDITARKQAEDKVREQAALLDLAHDAVIVRGLDSHILFWSRGATDTYGYSPEEALGRRAHELLQTVFPASLEAITTSIQQSREWEGELRHTRKDGSGIVVSSRWSLLRDEQGQPVAIMEINRDVTDRKQAEEALRKASHYTRSLIEASLDPLVTISREGKITDVNEATEKVTGVSRQRLIGTDFSNCFTEPEKARAGYEKVFAQGAVHDYPLAIRSASGVVTDVLYNASVFRNEAGEVEGVFAAARDVTERKQAELALQESETKFRTLSELVPQMVWACTPDGLNVYFNQRWVEYTGLTLEESYGRGWNTPFHQDDKQAAWDAWNRAVATGDTYHIESRLRAADGSYRWFLMRGVPLRDASGTIVKWFGTCTDIDDLRDAQGKLARINQELEQRVQERTAQWQESERRVRRKLETILSPEGKLGNLELPDLLDTPAVQALVNDFYELAHIPMFILDLKGNVLASVGWQDVCTKFHRAHPEACLNCQESDRELSAGVAPGEFKLYKCKNNLWDVVTPIMVGGEHVGNLFSGQFFFSEESVDYALFRSQAQKYGFDDGEYLAALDRVPRLSRAAVSTGMAFYMKLAQMLSQLSYSGVKLARSMTETGRANAELAASVKELEAFTYAVAHDLRAPLRHIHGFAEMLADEARPVLTDSCKHQLDTILDSVQHMSQLLEDLLKLSRLGRQELSKQLCSANGLIAEVINALEPESKGRDVEWRITELPPVECDPALFKQVLVNLLSNALKFTRTRHPAIIEIGQTTIDGEAVIFIRDNGVGYSMKYADKLFGLFQRLHHQQDFEGTGVGLAIVQRIMHRHGGRVWAEAELDKGATFYLSLHRGEAGKKELAAARAAI